MGNSIRANWHVADLDLPDGDPMTEMSQLQSEGTVIDLTATGASLQSSLQAQLRLEGRVTNRGDGCELKWEDRHVLQGGGSFSCYTCPHFSDERLICRVGRKQMDLIEQLAALRIVDSLETEIAAAHARHIEECVELADFALA